MPSSDTPKHYITWTMLHHAIAGLQAQMDRDGYAPERVLALGKGAMIPARLLAPEGVEVYYVGISSYKGKERGELVCYQHLPDTLRFLLDSPSTLVVDDLWDSGQTFEWAGSWFPEAKTAALLTKSSAHSLDFWGASVDGKPWIVFPWE